MKKKAFSLTSIKEWLDYHPGFAWSLYALGVVVFLITTLLFWILYGKSSAIFFTFWIGIPIGTKLFTLSRFSKETSKKRAGQIRVISIVIVIVLSATMYFNYEEIRDDFGLKFIKGYEKYESIAEYQDEIREVTKVMTAHWTGRVVLWVHMGFFYILIIGIPLITWKICTRFYNKFPKVKERID